MFRDNELMNSPRTKIDASMNFYLYYLYEVLETPNTGCTTDWKSSHYVYKYIGIQKVNLDEGFC